MEWLPLPWNLRLPHIGTPHALSIDFLRLETWIEYMANPPTPAIWTDPDLAGHTYRVT